MLTTRRLRLFHVIAGLHTLQEKTSKQIARVLFLSDLDKLLFHMISFINYDTPQITLISDNLF